MPHITFNSTLSHFSKNIRILELTLDQKLSWNPHVKKLKSTYMSRMNIIKVLSHISCGSDQNSLIIIYKSLILSIINYGSTLYNSVKKGLLNSLNSIHNLGIRLSTGALRTSPVDSILCNAGEPPLQIIRNMNIAKYIIKISNLPNHISSSYFHCNFQIIPTKTPTTIFENFKNTKEETDIDISLINKIPFPSSAP